MFERRLFTDLVLEAVAIGTNKPVAVADKPPEGGWQGEPNKDNSTYIPYSVVTPLSSNGASGPFDDSSADRRLPYAVACYGVTPVQCEWMADKARSAIAAMAKQIYTLERDYKVQQVRADVIGALVRIDVVDPAVWGESDVIELWLTPK